MKKIIFVLLVIHTGLMAGYTRDATTNIVTDHMTHLQWQDNSVGGLMTWEEAITYCENLTMGAYSDWRLPNLNELTSIVDDTAYDPSLNSVFQNYSHFYYYWSSTTYDLYKNQVAYVYFKDGSQKIFSKTNHLLPRCVREGL